MIGSMKTGKSIWTLKRTLPIIFVILGSIGVLASAILTVEKIHLLQNPALKLNCDINPIVACGSVINTDQASAFGFPNPFLGLIGFAVVVTTGMAILAGASFKRWFWLGLQAGTIFGVVFISWLQFQSIYRIGALCPYCMVVWAVMIPIFWYTTLYNLREGHIKLARKYLPISNFLQRHHGDVLVSWYLLVIGVILRHFWFYWSTLL